MIEEGNGFGAEFFEPLAEQFLFAPYIRTRPMFMMTAVLARRRSRQTLVTRNLTDVRIVNDDFALGDAYGQELSDTLPRNGVKILQVTDETFRIHRAVDHFGRVVGFFRKRQ